MGRRGGYIDGTEVNACHIFMNSLAGILIGDAAVKNTRVSGGAYAQNGAAGIAIAGGV